jgi:diadenylate cyclase
MLEKARTLWEWRSGLGPLLDVLDILVVAYLIYRVLLVLRGTRAMQIGIGLLSLAGIYLAGRWLGLVTLTTLLSGVLSSIILVVVVVFQSDLRRALMRAGARPFLGLTRDDEAKVIEEVIAAVTELAKLRHGAIITWERNANLDEFIVGSGTTLDAQVSRELLVSIFIPVGENKLHDGAVIIRNMRIAQAGVFFPMPEKQGLDKKFGSRHRASLGITADTDAIAIVVSEERGTIMFAFQENHVDNVSPDALRNLLRRYEQPKKRKAKPQGPTSSRRSLPPPSSSLPPPVKIPTAPLPVIVPSESKVPAPIPSTRVGPTPAPIATPIIRESTTPPRTSAPPPNVQIPDEGADQ